MGSKFIALYQLPKGKVDSVIQRFVITTKMNTLVVEMYCLQILVLNYDKLTCKCGCCGKFASVGTHTECVDLKGMVT